MLSYLIIQVLLQLAQVFCRAGNPSEAVQNITTDPLTR